MSDSHCGHPDCYEHSCGIRINKIEVCKDHIDWAMAGVIAPIKNGLKTYEHVCPDWDYLIIDKNDPEIMGCTCDFTKEVRQAWDAFYYIFPYQ